MEQSDVREAMAKLAITFGYKGNIWVYVAE